jgi:hypothetical protein
MAVQPYDGLDQFAFLLFTFGSVGKPTMICFDGCQVTLGVCMWPACEQRMASQA